MEKNIFFTGLIAVNAWALPIPSTDTALLMSLVSNTTSEIARLEELISEQKKHTEAFVKTVELAQEQYDRVEAIQNTAFNLTQIAQGSPEDLAALNDKISELKDTKERLKNIIEEARKTEAEQELNQEAFKGDMKNSSKEIETSKRQFSKSLNNSNTGQQVAQNTALIHGKLIGVDNKLSNLNMSNSKLLKIESQRLQMEAKQLEQQKNLNVKTKSKGKKL